MPIYEFDCQACGEPFEELVFSTTAVKDLTCPSCGSPKIKKKLSTFAARLSGGPAASSAASCSTGSL